MRYYVIVLVLVQFFFIQSSFGADAAHAGHKYTDAEIEALKKERDEAIAARDAALPAPPKVSVSVTSSTVTSGTKTPVSSPSVAELAASVDNLANNIKLLNEKVENNMTAIVDSFNRTDARIQALEAIARRPVVRELPTASAAAVPVMVNGKEAGSIPVTNGIVNASIPIDADTRDVCIKIRKKGDKSSRGSGGGGGGRPRKSAPEPDFEVTPGITPKSSPGVSVVNNNVNGSGSAVSGFQSGYQPQQSIPTYSAPPPQYSMPTYSAPPPDYSSLLSGFGGFGGGYQGGGFRGGYRGGGNFRGGFRRGGFQRPVFQRPVFQRPVFQRPVITRPPAQNFQPPVRRAIGGSPGRN